MSFVNEKISVEDSAKVHWEQYPEYQNQWKLLPSLWTIDRDRDVFFWHIKGRIPEWPNQIFGLYWKGSGEIRIEAIETLKDTPGTAGKLCDISWQIVKISLPELLETERNFIKEVIKEAFEVFARRLGDDGIGSLLISIH